VPSKSVASNCTKTSKTLNKTRLNLPGLGGLSRLAAGLG